MTKTFIALSLLLTSVAFATSYGSNMKKFYCNADEIEIREAGILVHLDEGVLEIDHLQVDQGGLYFLEDSARCTDCRRPVLNPKNTCECPLVLNIQD